MFKMAKKRKKEDIEELEDKEDDEELGVRNWIIKTILMGVFLFFLVILIEVFFKIPVLTDTIIAVSIVMAIGFLHEGLHYREAIKLGYEPKWYRTVFTMGFEIHHETTKAIWDKHKRIIGHAPYKVIIPLSFFILGFGLLLNSLGMIVAALGSFLLHIISYTQEGRDV